MALTSTDGQNGDLKVDPLKFCFSFKTMQRCSFVEVLVVSLTYAHNKTS